MHCQGRGGKEPEHKGPSICPTVCALFLPVAVAHVQHQELGRAADLGMPGVRVSSWAGAGVRYEHQEPGRLERGQSSLGAASGAVAGDDLRVEGGDALIARVRGSVVFALGARVAAVTAEKEKSTKRKRAKKKGRIRQRTTNQNKRKTQKRIQLH